jgi:2-hydroxychromene-2-carboxylate isomerase
MDELDAAAAREADRLETVIAANEAAQKAAGHWGVPLMAFEGEPFFGQDRVDHLIWRMKQHGLRKRG